MPFTKKIGGTFNKIFASRGGEEVKALIDKCIKDLSYNGKKILV